MLLFLSTFQNRIDKKGRVSVPASFRTTLAQQAFPGVIVFRSFTGACIEGCGIDFMERLTASTDRLDLFSPEQDDLTSLIFAESRQLPWDAEGRIMLPDDLAAHAGITDIAAFVGKGRTFQIWNPDAYRIASDEARQRALRNRPTLALDRQPGEVG